MSDCLRLISGSRPDRAKERSGAQGGKGEEGVNKEGREGIREERRGEGELQRHVLNERRREERRE